jgi:hypothetical protein
MANRPTLGELAAQSSGGEGWECPRCGCCDWRVDDSYYVASAGERRRRRFCRHCKQVIYTAEVVVAGPKASNSTPVDESLTILAQARHSAKHDDATNNPGSDRIHGQKSGIGDGRIADRDGADNRRANRGRSVPSRKSRRSR